MRVMLREIIRRLRSRAKKPEIEPSGPLTTEEVLREEALAIAGEDLLSALAATRDASSLSDAERKAFYRQLNSSISPHYVFRVAVFAVQHSRLV